MSQDGTVFYGLCCPLCAIEVEISSARYAFNVCLGRVKADVSYRKGKEAWHASPTRANLPSE